MKTIEIGTIVFYVHREAERSNGSYVSPAIVTRPWSQDGALNITVIPDYGLPTPLSSVMHAVSLNDMANGHCWLTREECSLLRIDLSNPFLDPHKLMNDRIAIREELSKEGGQRPENIRWLNPLTLEEGRSPIPMPEPERLPAKDQLDPGD